MGSETAERRQRALERGAVGLGLLLVTVDVLASGALFALLGLLLIALRRRAQKLLFAAVAIGLAALLLEGGARVVSPLRERPTPAGPVQPPAMRDDAVLNHRWTPSMVYRSRSRGIQFELRTNAQSWVEDEDVVRAKPPGTFRIFYLGDSNTTGVAERGSNLCDLLEPALAAAYPAGPRIELINCGTSSYSPIILYLQLRTEVLAYDPDLVVLQVDMTDVVNDAEYRRTAIFTSSGEPVAVLPNPEAYRAAHRMTPTGTVRVSAAERLRVWLVDNSAFCAALAGVLEPLRPVHAPDLRPQPQPANWLLPEWTPEIERNVADTLGHLDRCAELARAHGVRLALVSVPHHRQFTGQQSARPHAELARWAARNGVPYLDSFAALEPRVRGTPQDTYYWASDPTHFNAAGNALWTEVQLEFLLARRGELLPP